MGDAEEVPLLPHERAVMRPPTPPANMLAVVRDTTTTPTSPTIYSTHRDILCVCHSYATAKQVLTQNSQSSTWLILSYRGHESAERNIRVGGYGEGELEEEIREQLWIMEVPVVYEADLRGGGLGELLRWGKPN